MSYNYQFQFELQGPFAVVDAHSRNIWINITNESHAHAIRKTFCGKLNTLICDLSKFENFKQLENTINSYTCLDWRIPPTDDFSLIAPSVVSDRLANTITQYHSSKLCKLYNDPVKSFLSEERRNELQDQILLYNRILELLEMATDYDHAVFAEFRAQIDKIFQTEINLKLIIDRLHQLTLLHIGVINIVPSCILTTIRKNLYE
jgi:uncharacterized membrane protein